MVEARHGGGGGGGARRGGGVRSPLRALDGDLADVGRESELRALKVVTMVKDEVDANEVDEAWVIARAELPKPLAASFASHPSHPVLYLGRRRRPPPSQATPSHALARLSAPPSDSNFGGYHWRLKDVNTLSILHYHTYCYITYSDLMVGCGQPYARNDC
jgi:hypothetical protein